MPLLISTTAAKLVKFPNDKIIFTIFQGEAIRLFSYKKLRKPVASSVIRSTLEDATSTNSHPAYDVNFIWSNHPGSYCKQPETTAIESDGKRLGHLSSLEGKAWLEQLYKEDKSGVSSTPHSPQQFSVSKGNRIQTGKSTSEQARVFQCQRAVANLVRRNPLSSADLTFWKGVKLHSMSQIGKVETQLEDSNKNVPEKLDGTDELAWMEELEAFFCSDLGEAARKKPNLVVEAWRSIGKCSRRETGSGRLSRQELLWRRRSIRAELQQGQVRMAARLHERSEVFGPVSMRRQFGSAAIPLASRQHSNFRIAPKKKLLDPSMLRRSKGNTVTVEFHFKDSETPNNVRPSSNSMDSSTEARVLPEPTNRSVTNFLALNNNEPPIRFANKQTLSELYGFLIQRKRERLNQPYYVVKSPSKIMSPLREWPNRKNLINHDENTLTSTKNNGKGFSSSATSSTSMRMVGSSLTSIGSSERHKITSLSENDSRRLELNYVVLSSVSSPPESMRQILKDRKFQRALISARRRLKRIRDNRAAPTDVDTVSSLLHDLNNSVEALVYDIAKNSDEQIIKVGFRVL